MGYRLQWLRPLAYLPVLREGMGVGEKSRHEALWAGLPGERQSPRKANKGERRDHRKRHTHTPRQTWGCVCGVGV